MLEVAGQFPFDRYEWMMKVNPQKFHVMCTLGLNSIPNPKVNSYNYVYLLFIALCKERSKEANS